MELLHRLCVFAIRQSGLAHAKFLLESNGNSEVVDCTVLLLSDKRSFMWRYRKLAAAA
jgi:hypothetical protein